MNVESRWWINAESMLSHPQFGAAVSDNCMTAPIKRCGLALILSSIMIPMV
jgi:hypothetical protein